jgi:hypothetical protein
MPAPPPAAPRPISDKYAWRLLFTDGWGIGAFVLGLLGAIFSFLGVVLTLVVVTAFVGVPFLVLGLIFLGVALAVGAWRYHRARQVVNVLRNGESTRGQILDVRQDYSVRVNQRHPWLIRYGFQVNAGNYEGKVRTLHPVGTRYQAGKPVWVLYVPDAPQWNAIYPHP